MRTSCAPTSTAGRSGFSRLAVAALQRPDCQASTRSSQPSRHLPNEMPSGQARANNHQALHETNRHLSRSEVHSPGAWQPGPRTTWIRGIPFTPSVNPAASASPFTRNGSLPAHVRWSPCPCRAPEVVRLRVVQWAVSRRPCACCSSQAQASGRTRLQWSVFARSHA